MHFPVETFFPNRDNLMSWLSIKLRDDGEVMGDSDEVQKRMFGLQRQIKYGEITLKEIYEQISPHITRGLEGRPSFKEGM